MQANQATAADGLSEISRSMAAILLLTGRERRSALQHAEEQRRRSCDYFWVSRSSYVGCERYCLWIDDDDLLDEAVQVAEYRERD